MGGWALTPPNFQNLRPIDYLLGSIQTTFPPANDVSPHPYFEKFKPFAVDALASRDSAVLKRGKSLLRMSYWMIMSTAHSLCLFQRYERWNSFFIL